MRFDNQATVEAGLVADLSLWIKLVARGSNRVSVERPEGPNRRDRGVWMSLRVGDVDMIQERHTDGHVFRISCGLECG